MNKIEIIISNMIKDTTIVIDVDELKILFNDKYIEITREKIDDLLRIIRTWKSNDDKKIIDDEKYIIKINILGEEDKISGYASMEDDYYLLKEWISDLND